MAPKEKRFLLLVACGFPNKEEPILSVEDTFETVASGFTTDCEIDGKTEAVESIKDDAVDVEGAEPKNENDGLDTDVTVDCTAFTKELIFSPELLNDPSNEDWSAAEKGISDPKAGTIFLDWLIPNNEEPIIEGAWVARALLSLSCLEPKTVELTLPVDWSQPKITDADFSPAWLLVLKLVVFTVFPKLKIPEVISAWETSWVVKILFVDSTERESVGFSELPKTGIIFGFVSLIPNIGQDTAGLRLKHGVVSVVTGLLDIFWFEETSPFVTFDAVVVVKGDETTKLSSTGPFDDWNPKEKPKNKFKIIRKTLQIMIQEYKQQENKRKY